MFWSTLVGVDDGDDDAFGVVAEDGVVAVAAAIAAAVANAPEKGDKPGGIA